MKSKFAQMGDTIELTRHFIDNYIASIPDSHSIPRTGKHDAQYNDEIVALFMSRELGAPLRTVVDAFGSSHSEDGTVSFDVDTQYGRVNFYVDYRDYKIVKRAKKGKKKLGRKK